MKYVVSETKDAVDAKTGKPCKCWYVHLEGFNYVPVFGSFGTKEHANKICKLMNRR